MHIQPNFYNKLHIILNSYIIFFLLTLIQKKIPRKFLILYKNLYLEIVRVSRYKYKPFYKKFINY